MKPVHSIETNTSPVKKPLQCAEAAVNAKLLYIYVGQPELSFEHWAESLHHMVASPGHVLRFRLMTGVDGELALNFEFAAHFAQRVSGDLMGAIALVLIDEGCRALKEGDAGYTNRMLQEFEVLASAGGLMHAETLHAFLQIEETYERWVARLLERFCMVYGRDYIRVTFSIHSGPKEHPKDNGKGEIMFGSRCAMKVAAEEPTPRGEFVRRCLDPGMYDGTDPNRSVL